MLSIPLEHNYSIDIVTLIAFFLTHSARLVAVATPKGSRWLGIAVCTQEKKLMNSSRFFMTDDEIRGFVSL